MRKRHEWMLVPAICALALAAPARAQDDAATELAKKLSNPLASLISLPFQYDHDGYGGANDGASVDRLNVKPVVPFSISKDWNLISRTIIPLVDQGGFPSSAMNESGLGDINSSLFFSPKLSTGGWTWGAGPVLLLPTATEDVLGTEKWGVGPTGVVLKQTGPWTIGLLANHIWSVAGSDSRGDVSATFLQPFLTYTTRTHTTLSANTESTYDWNNEQWQVPLHVAVAQMLKIGPQVLQVQVAGRYWAEAPDDGPEGWSLRLQLTLLFPR